VTPRPIEPEEPAAERAAAVPPPPASTAAWHERIPPALWFFGCLLAGWGLERSWPLTIPFPSLAWQLGPALGLFAAAGALAVWAMAQFRAQQTTLLPFGRATSLLDRGPFRWSRNPLYVALVATLAAFGLLLASCWILAATLALGAALDRWVIPEEEARMTELFGERYAGYAARVRRWL